jgi:UDP-glucuronate decarboxylase
MRCFVTGGGGFIGSRAVRQMAATGWDVAILALPGESLSRIDDLRNRIEIVEAELADVKPISAFLARWRPDACLHAAWYAEPGKYLESPKNTACQRESIVLLEILIGSGCRSVTMVGTCAEYANSLSPLKEDSPTSPTTLYGYAKLETSRAAEKLAAHAGIPLAWARIFYLFGPDEDPRRMVPSLIQALLEEREFAATAGDQVRDYLHVDDVASGLITLLRESASGVHNVCSGEPVSVRRIMTMIGEEMGKPELIRFGAIPYRDGESPFVCGDSSRLRQLGWHPRYGLLEAVRRTLEHWQSRSHDHSH